MPLNVLPLLELLDDWHESRSVFSSMPAPCAPRGRSVTHALSHTWRATAGGRASPHGRRTTVWPPQKLRRRRCPYGGSLFVWERTDAAGMVACLAEKGWSEFTDVRDAGTQTGSVRCPVVPQDHIHTTTTTGNRRAGLSWREGPLFVSAAD